MTFKSNQLHLGIFFVLWALLLSNTYCQVIRTSNSNESSQIFALKKIIEADMKITKSLSVSPVDSRVVVGGQGGIIKVFDYQSGQKKVEMRQQSSEITGVLWQNYSEGLVTISVNHTDNTSLAVQRNSQTLEQVHRWQFASYIYNADSISSRHDNYVAFNFMTHVEQYNLKSRKKSTTYTPTENRLFVEMSYSSQYSYLYLSGNGQFMYAFKCGTIYRFYYGTSDIISSFEADKSNTQHSPVIYKKQSQGFQVLDPNYQFNVSFPHQKINFFKYCPKDFIVGVGLDDSITIFSRDYKFNKLGYIDTFVGQDIFVLNLVCKNDRIIVTASNNNIYVFQLRGQQNTVSEKWIWVVVIASAVTLVLILTTICLVRRYRASKERKRTDSPSLLTSQPKSSVVSELFI